MAHISRFSRYSVHPANPQPRLLMHAAAMLREGAVAAIPTATGYQLACRLDDKAAGDKLRWLMGMMGDDDREPPLLMCRSLTRASAYVRVDDQAFRAIRGHEPGSEAFLLPCTRNVPRRLAPKGLARLSFAGHAATQALLEFLDEPLLVATVDGNADDIDALPRAWLDALDVAIDVGPLVNAEEPMLEGMAPQTEWEPEAVAA